MSARCLSVLSFVGVACLAGSASAFKCDVLPDPAYVMATSSAEPMVREVAKLLERTDPLRQMVVFQIAPACAAVEALAKDNATGSCAPGACMRGKAYFFPLDGAPEPNRPGVCDLDIAGQKIDLVLSDVFPQNCPGYGPNLPPGLLSFVGPAAAYSFAMLKTTAETAIHAEEAHFVFGAGQRAQLKPWLSDARLAHLGPKDGGTLLVGSRINLPPPKWKGVVSESTDELVDVLYSDPAQSLILLPTSLVDQRRNELRPLAFRALGQKTAYFPDRRLPSSDKATFEKQNVRDGHYPLWGYVHAVLRQDPTRPSQPLSAKGDRLASIFLGQTLVGGQDSLVLQVQSGLVPQCAMQVSKTSDAGPMSVSVPKDNCRCLFEHNVKQGALSCQRCEPGVCTAGVCRHKYCEAE